MRRGPSGCRSAVLLGSLASVLAPTALHAEEPVDLVWEAPPGCPKVAAVRERIRALSGDSLRTAGGLRAEGRIVRVDGRYRLTLRVRDAGSVRERTIAADTCADLAGAAAVALGLLLRKESPAASEALGSTTATGDGDAERRGSEATEAGASGTERAVPTAEGTPAANAAVKGPTKATGEPKASDGEAKASDGEAKTSDGESPSSGTASDRRWNVLLVAPLGTFDIGPLPKSMLGGGAGLGFRYDAWRFTGVGRTAPGQALGRGDSSGVGARATLTTTEVLTCYGFRTNRFELAPCVTAGLDWLTVRGTGPNVAARSGHSTVLALGAGAAAHLHVFGWLAVVATAAVGVETSRPRFVVEGFGEVRRLGPLRVAWAMGPEWIF